MQSWPASAPSDREMPTTGAFWGLILGVLLAYSTVYFHEAIHWLLVVPFGGSLSGWHSFPPPGWSFPVFPSNLPGILAPYAGGLGASLLLGALLMASFWRWRSTENPFWRGLGVPFALGCPLEFIAGIFEGAGGTLSRIPHLAKTSDAVNRQLSCFSSRYMNLLAVFQI